MKHLYPFISFKTIPVERFQCELTATLNLSAKATYRDDINPQHLDCVTKTLIRELEHTLYGDVHRQLTSYTYELRKLFHSTRLHEMEQIGKLLELSNILSPVNFEPREHMSSSWELELARERIKKLEEHIEVREKYFAEYYVKKKKRPSSPI